MLRLFLLLLTLFIKYGLALPEYSNIFRAHEYSNVNKSQSFEIDKNISKSISVENILLFGRRFLYLSSKHSSLQKNNQAHSSPYKKTNNTKIKKPLLVLFHGCKQSPQIIVNGTRAADYLAYYDLLVPMQEYFYNIDLCWNWFLPNNQYRTSFGEMRQVLEAIRFLTRSYSQKIFLIGFSSGAAIAHNLAVCYPEVFSGVALYAGIPYGTSLNYFNIDSTLLQPDIDDTAALALRAHRCHHVIRSKYKERKNKQFKLRQFIIFHGEKDERVSPTHSYLLSSITPIFFDYKDDGKLNSSVKTSIDTIQTSLFKRVTHSSKSFDQQTYRLFNTEHVWSGGVDVTRNFSKKGIRTIEYILDFFNLRERKI